MSDGGTVAVDAGMVLAVLAGQGDGGGVWLGVLGCNG